jgi:3-isopropylmalate dehydratase small subunit
LCGVFKVLHDILCIDSFKYIFVNNQVNIKILMMQYDPTWENRTFEKTKIESGKENSVVQNKSVSTYDSYQTGESKRSTEEEELRSLSTTPRYSHEDLGKY